MSDVIAWLESPEGEEWSRDRTRWQPSSAAPQVRMTAASGTLRRTHADDRTHA